MRSRKALVNSIWGLAYEFVAVICGFIVPRLILGAFGSSYNGITSSIAQFLACAELFKRGITGVTKASLYDPLSRHDDDGISAVVLATEHFMRRLALIFAGAVFVFALLYPFLVEDEFDYFFSFTLVLILGIGTFVQYYFGFTYQALLEADQKYYITMISGIAIVVANTVIAAILIGLGCSIHVVKLGSAAAFCLNPLIFNLYVRKHYNINRKVTPNKAALKQRWDAFGQSLAAFVHNNTDIVVLTFLSTVYEISVYTVYYMVCNGLKKVISTLTAGVGAAFGNMMAKGEEELMQKNMDIFEYVGMTFSTVIFTIAGIMMLPFVTVYTKGIKDVNYIRPVFSLVMVVGMAIYCFRIPYQSVVEAAGHYRQTRRGALIEAVVNIVVSVATVMRFGLVGVAIGTFIANLIRTGNYVTYVSRHLMKRSFWKFIRHLLSGLVIVAVTYELSNLLGIISATTYFDFALHAAICALICIATALIVSLTFYKETLFAFVSMFKGALVDRMKTK